MVNRNEKRVIFEDRALFGAVAIIVGFIIAAFIIVYVSGDANLEADSSSFFSFLRDLLISAGLIFGGFTSWWIGKDLKEVQRNKLETDRRIEAAKMRPDLHIKIKAEHVESGNFTHGLIFVSLNLQNNGNVPININFKQSLTVEEIVFDENISRFLPDLVKNTSSMNPFSEYLQEGERWVDNSQEKMLLDNGTGYNMEFVVRPIGVGLHRISFSTPIDEARQLVIMDQVDADENCDRIHTASCVVDVAS